MRKLLIILLIALPITAYGASYTLTTVDYPINVNGQKLACEPLNLNGSTYLPLRAISEAVGVPITWNNATRSVEITTLDVDKLKKSCVMINAESSTKGTQGSAVAWDYGEYLTAYHIVDNGKTSIVSSDNSNFKVDETDSKLDIATLDTDNNVKPVKIGDSDEVKLGDAVILISSPQKKENTISYGKVVINSTWIIAKGSSDVGSSGGGAFNTKGELIGILISGDTRIGEYCIVPINDIRKAL